MIDFNLLKLQPKDRSLLPQNAPGTQLFNAMQQKRALDIQQAGIFGNLQARQSELQETQRSNLAQEADRAAGREFEQQEFGEKVRQFNANFGLADREVSVLEKRLNHDIDEDMFDRELKREGMDLKRAQFMQDIVEAQRQYDLKAELGRGHLEINAANAMTNRDRFEFEQQQVLKAQEENKRISDIFENEGPEAAALEIMRTKGPDAAMPFLKDYAQLSKYKREAINGNVDAAKSAAKLGRFSGETLTIINEMQDPGQQEQALLRAGKSLKNLEPSLNIDSADPEAIRRFMSLAVRSSQIDLEAHVKGARNGNIGSQAYIYEFNNADSETNALVNQEASDVYDAGLNAYTPPKEIMSEAEYIRLKTQGATLTDSQKGNIIKETNQLENAMDDLESIAEVTEEEYLTYKGQFSVVWSKAKEMMGVPLDKASKEDIIRAVELQGRAGRYLAAVLKARSGATVSDSEFKRTAQNEVSSKMSFTQLKTSLKDSFNENRRRINKNRAMLGQPLFNKSAPFSDGESKVDKVPGQAEALGISPQQRRTQFNSVQDAWRTLR